MHIGPRRHSQTIWSVLFLMLFSAGVSYAVPPATPYQPGETLDPSCMPGDANCFVQILPDQTGRGGQYLTTDGDVTSWAVLPAGYNDENAQDAIGTILSSEFSYDDLTPLISINTVGAAKITGTKTATFISDFDTAVQAVGDVRYAQLSGTYANPSWITSLAWSKLTGTPTTLSGYGITDAYTQTQIQNFFAGTTAISGYNKTNWDTAYGWGNHATQGYLTDLSSFTTTDLAEGTNLYYTNGRADARVALAVSGTANYIPKFTGTNTLGNSTIFDNGTNVGVGTASPSAKLHSLATTEQLRLGYDASKYVGFTVDTSNNLTIVPGTSTTAGFSFGYLTGKGSGSNFFGNYAGYSISTAANNSNFFGYQAGYNTSTTTSQSNFFGPNAGYQASQASNSNFFGNSAGYTASYASNSNFFGSGAGNSAASASNSNFFGNSAGSNAASASNSNFFGNRAGIGATNASYSNFIGSNAGESASTARNSIFIGQSAGSGDAVNNTSNADDFSILIGKSTSTGGFKNSIAIGGSATNTASNQFMLGSATRPINDTRIIGTTSSMISFVSNSSGTPVNAAIGQLAAGGLTLSGGGTIAANPHVFINTSGNVGIGKTSAATKLNIFGVDPILRMETSANAMDIKYTTSGGGAAQRISIGQGGGAELLTVLNDGNVGIGTIAPVQKLDVQSIANANIHTIGNTDSSGYGESGTMFGVNGSDYWQNFIYASNATAFDSLRWYSMVSGTSVMVLTSAGNLTITGALTQSSDYRLKENITLLDGQSWSLQENLTSQNDTMLDRIMALRPVTYTMKADESGQLQSGFIAQEVQDIFPELVSLQTQPKGNVGSSYALNYIGLIPYTIAAIQEMNITIQSLPRFEDVSMATKVADFLRGIAQGVANIGRVRTDELCVGSTCVTEYQLQQLLQQSGTTGGSYTPPADPEPTPAPSGDTPADPDTSGDTAPTDSSATPGDTGTPAPIAPSVPETPSTPAPTSESTPDTSTPTE